MGLNLLLIETGGTFGTAPGKDGTRGLTGTSVLELPVVISFMAEREISFTVERPLYLLSENMRLSVLTKLLTYLQHCDFSKYDGIVISHGSDTLAYTVNLAAFLLGTPAVPVVFVAADRPLEDGASNGLANFFGALSFISRKIPGVFAVYRNGDGVTYVHRGGLLRQMDDLHSGFYSQRQAYFGTVTESEFRRSAKAKDEVKASPFPFKALSSGVIQIFPYPGLRYGAVSLSDAAAVLLRTYHTGMYCSMGQEESLDALLESLPLTIPVFCSGGNSREPRYVSDLRYKDRIIFIDDVAPEAIYAKALLAFGSLNREEAIDYVEKNILGEKVDY